MSRKWERIYFILAIIIAGMIFISSSMTYHQQTITPELGRLNLDWLKHWLAPIQIHYAGHLYSVETSGLSGMIEFMIRKLAHFGSNFLLGLFAYWGFTSKVPSKFFRAILIWLSCTGYAATDEFHQLLTGDRTPMIQDVMLDSTGALFGVLVALLVVILMTHKLNLKRSSGLSQQSN